jgi:hypothetical protein
MGNIVLERRIGTFSCTSHMIERFPDAVLAIMQHVIVVDVIHDIVDDIVIYVGYSHFFDPVPENQIPTEYTWIVERDRNNNVDHIRVSAKG